MKLENHKNKQPFTVPEGYFDNLEGNIMKMLPHSAVATPQKKARTIGFAKYLRHIGYAATIAVIFSLGSYMFLKSNGEPATADEYYSNEYIDEVLNNYPIDDYTFYCYVTENY